MGKRERDKGARGEREFANLIAERAGREVARNLSQSRDGGCDLLDVGPFAVEVKRCETLAIPSWIRQAEAQAAEVRKWPALAYRQSRRPWIVVVPISSIRLKEPTPSAFAPYASIEIDPFVEILLDFDGRG